MFSSHDAECQFVLSSKQQCITLLKAAMPPEYSGMLINKLIENQGFYLTCNDFGGVEKYGSFKEYLAKNE